MLVAVLHHKLSPAEERMEDLLTAQILGAAAYLPSGACWTPLIASARRLDGMPLALPDPAPDIVPRFWPRWPHGGEDPRTTEPDLVLRWPGALVLIEVKYRSGKSSEASEDPDRVTDQLARQLILTRTRAQAEGRSAWGVIYLTAHATLPRPALASALDEVQTKDCSDLAAHLAWTSWHDVHSAFAGWSPEPPGEQRLRADLLGYLGRLGFGRFAGFAARPTPPPRWRFAAQPRSPPFAWPQLQAPAPWCFTAADPAPPEDS